LLAAEKLGVAISDCLIFEDAPAGIAAAKAAGASLLVMTQTHPHDHAGSDNGDQCSRDYTALSVYPAGEGWTLQQQ
jgi:sugar-phosphatase